MIYLKLNGYQIAQALESIGWSSSGGGDGGGSVTYSATAPVTSENGSLWFDTINEKLKMYNGGVWTGMSLSQEELQAFNTAISSNLPEQAGNEGKFLTTDGETASWVEGSGGTINDSWLTPMPTFELELPVVEENQPINVTITNYDAEVTYEIKADKGTISNVNNNTFTYTAPDITNQSNGIDTIYVSGYKSGLLKSKQNYKALIYTYVAMEADDVLVNVNFGNNKYYSDGVEYL